MIAGAVRCAFMLTWACAVGATVPGEPPAAGDAPAPVGESVAIDASATAAAVLRRDDLIGVWRLVRIEYADPRGSHPDPFYQADSTGLLIYDASGWMSVQIVGPDRRVFEIPARRPGPSAGTRRAALETAAFDSYYAYYGTFAFDERTSEVVHRVVASLLPAETGTSYTQRVTLEDGRLVFSNTTGSGTAAQSVRRKIWERVP